MSLSPRALDTLIDLVEIKLSCFEVYDREDSRELANLEQCRAELETLISSAGQAATVVQLEGTRRGKARAAG
ncbi:MAG: hypothetical protein AAF530_23170 [Pseudomonadota bacterium]